MCPKKHERNSLRKKEEESELIDRTNSLIKNVEKEIEYFSEDTVPNLLYCRMVTESTVLLILEKEGRIKGGSYSYSPLYKQLDYLKETNIMPANCIDYVKILNRYGSESVHLDPKNHKHEKSKQFYKAYFETFNDYLIWFNEFYSQRYSVKKPLKINRLSTLIETIFLVQKEENLEALKKEKEELKKESEELDKKLKSLQTNKKRKASQPESEENGIKLNDMNLSEYSENIEVKKGLMTKFNENIVQQKTIDGLILKNDYDTFSKNWENLFIILKRFEEKIDTIINKLDNQNNILQSFVSRQIESTDSKEEIERIIETYTKEIVDKIKIEYSRKIYNDEEYERERRNLKFSLGENAWNKLSNKSRTFLITSKLMYNDLIMIDEITDYSGVCILVTKALEEEMFKRFFIDFIDYCDEKFGNDFSKYHSSLLFNGIGILRKEKFSMGSIAYLLCYKYSYNIPYAEKQNNKKVLMDYCNEKIFPNNDDDEIENFLKDYARNIEKIKEDFRNPSAHRNEIKRIDAEECFNLVLDVERLLKRMLDSFDY